GILVDEATVAVENIYTHLARGADAGHAVLDAMREVLQPRFLAMLCIVAVFLPALFMVGISKALFPPLALAVGFSMVASFLLSSTLVPVLAAWLFRKGLPAEHAKPGARRGLLVRAREGYGRLAAMLVRSRWWVLLGYLVACVLGLWLARGLATELFPR